MKVIKQLAFVVIVLLLNSCSSKKDNANTKPYQKNEDLVIAYCGSCHQFPDPSLLTKKVWINKVLPNMATRMGFKWGFPYEGLSAKEIEEIIKRKVIPDHPIISEEMMLRIVKYYENNSADSLNPQNRTVVPDDNFSEFQVNEHKESPFSGQNILLKYLPDNQHFVRSYEDKGTWISKKGLDNPQFISKVAASDAASFGQNIYLLSLQTTKPYNLPTGSIITYNALKKTESLALDSLIRPVSMDVADLNADRKPDFIVCEFGDYLGQLSLHISQGNTHQKIVLKDYPGACKAIFKDMNADGLLDIVVLMSQAREELLIYYNRGKGQFQENSIAKFPPSYGSNHMQLSDFDGDNLIDIIMTNGDNADISSQLKNYHGIRIFKNFGKGKFTQNWFYPMYGASNLVIDDFDQDGKMDFAAISHFPDFKIVNYEDFIYFRNQGKNSFKPYKFKNPLNGRLLTMDKMDVDHDGDQDIIIGNYTDLLTDPGVKNYLKWHAEKSQAWVLTNNFKKH
jgi:FG-GAP-like repeat